MMANQDSNPGPWLDSMSDGCTGVVDKFPGVGNMRPCCVKHDRAHFFGGDEAAKKRADKRFKRCIADLGGGGRFGCILCKAFSLWRYRGVRMFGGPAWNWLGPGLPE